MNVYRGWQFVGAYNLLDGDIFTGDVVINHVGWDTPLRDKRFRGSLVREQHDRIANPDESRRHQYRPANRERSEVELLAGWGGGRIASTCGDPAGDHSPAGSMSDGGLQFRQHSQDQAHPGLFGLAQVWPP